MAGPVFATDPEAQVSAVELDGLSVLFHAPSGMTHIVAAPAPQILDALRIGPADAGELLARLRAWYDFESDDEVADAVDARLEELEAAGLVRRA